MIEESEAIVNSEVSAWLNVRLLTYQQNAVIHTSVSAAPPEPDPRLQVILQVLQTAESVWTASRPFFARWTMTSAQFNLLNLIADHPEGRSQADISRELLTHRSNVTGLVDRLETKSLVRRCGSVLDRRLWRISITPEGKKLVDLIRPEFHSAANQLTSNLSRAEVESLTRSLMVIAENSRQQSEQVSGKNP